MKKYRKCCQNDEMSALKLAFIITASIVVAAGVIMLLMRLCKKKHPHKLHECCCSDGDAADSWDIDEDVLNELELDDEDSEEDSEDGDASGADVVGADKPETENE